MLWMHVPYFWNRSPLNHQWPNANVEWSQGITYSWDYQHLNSEHSRILLERIKMLTNSHLFITYTHHTLTVENNHNRLVISVLLSQPSSPLLLLLPMLLLRLLQFCQHHWFTKALWYEAVEWLSKMDEQHRHIVLWHDQIQHSIDNGRSNWFQNVAQVIYNLPPPPVQYMLCLCHCKCYQRNGHVTSVQM